MPKVNPLKPKIAKRQRRYAQPGAVAADYGFSKATLWVWLQNGWIRSTVVRKEGSRKALRLVDLDSLETFLAINATGPSAETLVKQAAKNSQEVVLT